MSTGQPLLEICDVRKSYGAKIVLEDIDLNVQKGEVCTVVGPSGCGKSTLLRLILGQEFPDSGKLLLDGKPVGFPAPDRGIVYQRYGLYPHLSVVQNVTLGRSLQLNWSERRRQRTAHVIHTGG